MAHTPPCKNKSPRFVICSYTLYFHILRFEFKRYNPSYPWEYAYNPCYPWPDGTPNCNNVFVCQRSYNKHDDTFDVGDVTASWTNDATNYYVEYKHDEKYMFGFKLYKAPWEYAYNPCYPWSDGTPNCKSVIVCQRSYNKHDETFDVGDVTASWTNDATNYYVEYKHGEKTSIFTLKCDATAKIPTLSFLSQIENKYKFILTSECCCPGTCHTPTPTPTPPSRGSISVGSVICIVAAVLIVVYLIGGMFLMKFVKHAEGLEVIPNKDIWVNLPGYIKDGFLFVVTCGKHSA
ncbi:uncharacterized protein LOC110973210 isoform X1 [Acanthaster planci]|uniref:Uncharacterized protein LOC110973210 isoform X1 n=1 Tax=Acanthaster planci TaxID=133434 RepID=A0A8B7XH59_ACAPL|nr:uncharacterized protein LOC110973210 isoform X1 [Acanthaster planci]